MSPSASGPGTAIPRPTTVAATSLADLGRGRGVIRGDAAVEITGVTAASARVLPGDLFAALPGRSGHGAAYAADALTRGAVAVLTDAAGVASVPSGTPVLEVPDVRAVLGPVSADVYGRPGDALRMLGVTGTSGKTTTTFLMRAGLRAAGRVPGLIGTVATMIGDEEIETGFTTPEAPELQALLAVMRERGVTDVAMEVSSHALDMRRADGISFAVAGFTNLSEDHLDFHADMAEYFAAKTRLFTELAERSIVITDDEWGQRLADLLGDDVVRVNTAAGDAGAGWQAGDVRDDAAGATSFHVRVAEPGSPPAELDMRCAIPGRYNVANAVLAMAMLNEAGLGPQACADAIATASVPGRMERVDAGQPYLALVDYSHKPAAVEGALRALRPLTRGNLIIVLGCGGDRDRGKRPHMGAIAARDADLLVVTDDNPRSEDPAAIRAAMLEGALGVAASDRGEVLEVGSRAAAIAAAVGRARTGDTVLIAGKGHESGQEIAGVKHPFDDRDVLRTAIEEAPAIDEAP